MSRYKIAWLPGDGVGVDVMDATRIVLDRLKLDAEYIHGDIGWEFWCAEGDALPARTIELLKNVDAALFGAITSKPVKAAEAELVPSLRGTGLVYRSPDRAHAAAVRPLHLPAPLQGVSGQPPQPQRRDRHRRLPREHRGPVRRRRVQPGAGRTGRHAAAAVEAVRALRRPDRATSTRCRARSTRGRARSASSTRRSPSRASTAARRSPSCTRPTSCARPTACSSRSPARSAARYPEITFDEANVDAMTMWLLKNPLNYDVLVAPNLYGDIVSDLCAQMVGGLGFACSGNIGDEARRVRALARVGAEVRRPIQGQSDRHDSDGQDDARLARRDGNGRAASSAPRPPSSSRDRSAPTTWAAATPRSRWRRPSRGNSSIGWLGTRGSGPGARPSVSRSRAKERSVQ